jgi:hypothetical protein
MPVGCRVIRLGTAGFHAHDMPTDVALPQASSPRVRPEAKLRPASAPFEARSSTSVSQVPRPDFVPERRPSRAKLAARSFGELASSLLGLSGGAVAVGAGEFRWTASASTFVIAASRAILAVATSTA